VTIPFVRADINYDLRANEPGSRNLTPSSITGIPGHLMQNVVLEDIEITYPGRGSKAQAYFPLGRLVDLPEKVSDYPEFTMFGELPAWGLYVRHAKNITLKKVRLSVKKPDYRPAMVFHEVGNPQLSELDILVDAKPHAVVLKNVTNEELSGLVEARVKRLE